MTLPQIGSILRASCALERGRYAIVTERRRRLRWTLWRQRGANRADENAGSVRRSRVVLAPRPWRQSAQPSGGAATVTIKAAHRGEHEGNRKTIARGKPGCLGCTCLIRVLPFTTIAHGAAGASSARLSLRPLLEEGQRDCKTRANRAAGMRTHVSPLQIRRVG